MPNASAAQFPLPFDALTPDLSVEPVFRASKAVAWRTFGDAGPVRQWIVFPSFEHGVPNLTRHVRRAVLVQFNAAGIWLFLTDLRYRWPDTDLAHVAATCRQFLSGPCLNLHALHRSLAELIDSRFEVQLPCLSAEALAVSEVRAYAVDQIMGEALVPSAAADGTAAHGDLALRARQLETQVTGELSEALECFIAHLDSRDVRLASASGALSTQAFNMLTGPAAQAQRNRRQFFDTFPLFAGALLHGNASQAYLVGLREAVDTGAPMVQFLAQALDARPHTIRCVVGKSREELGRRWLASPARLIKLLDSLPPELRPTDARGWKLIDCLVAAAEDRALRPVSRALVRRAMEDWRSRVHEGDADANEEEMTEFAEQAEHVTEFWAALEDCLRTRAATTHRGVRPFEHRELRAMADSVVADRGWHGLVNLSRVWRHAVVHAQAAVQANKERLLGKRFAPLLQRERVIGDRVLVPLVTSGELQQEGRALQHCIGNYASACASGDSYILSIREAHSRCPLSTAEFQITRDRPGPVKITLRQHYGRGNATPARACTDAVQHLIAAADDADVQMHWATLLTDRLERQSNAPSAARRIAAILAPEHAIREVLRPRGRYERLLDQLLLTEEAPRCSATG